MKFGNLRELFGQRHRSESQDLLSPDAPLSSDAQRSLLASSAAVHPKTTALHIACKAGKRSEIAGLLATSNPLARDEDGATALQLFCNYCAAKANGISPPHTPSDTDVNALDGSSPPHPPSDTGVNALNRDYYFIQLPQNTIHGMARHEINLGTSYNQIALMQLLKRICEILDEQAFGQHYFVLTATAILRHLKMCSYMMRQ